MAALKIVYLGREEVMSILAEKRLYELADGSLVTEVPGGESGSLFCAPGDELAGERADRYEAAVAKKAAKKAEDKSVLKGEDK